MKKLIVTILLIFVGLHNESSAGLLFNPTNNLSTKQQQIIQKETAIKLLGQAIKLSEKTTNTAIRAEMTSSLAVVYMKLGDKNKAHKLLELSRGLLEKEVDLTKDCYECPSKEFFKTTIAINHFFAGETKEGLKILDEIVASIKQKTQYKRPTLLAGLAIIYAKFGIKERALNLLSESFEIAKTLDDNKGDVFVLEYISKRYASLGETDLALQVVETIKKGFRDHSLIAIARSYADKGQFDRALQLNKQIESENMKPDILIYVSDKYLKAGNKEKAVALLDEAVNMFYAANPEKINNSAPSDAIFLYVEAGQYNKASKLLDKVKGVRILSQLAVVYSKVGRNEDAEKLLNEAYNITKSSKGIYYHPEYLREIANACSIIGRKDRASTLLSEAISVLASEKDKTNHEIIYGELALSYQNIGDDINALKTLELIDDNFFGMKFETLHILASRYAGVEQVLKEINSMVREFYIA